MAKVWCSPRSKNYIVWFNLLHQIVLRAVLPRIVQDKFKRYQHVNIHPFSLRLEKEYNIEPKSFVTSVYLLLQLLYIFRIPYFGPWIVLLGYLFRAPLVLQFHRRCRPGETIRMFNMFTSRYISHLSFKVALVILDLAAVET